MFVTTPYCMSKDQKDMHEFLTYSTNCLIIYSLKLRHSAGLTPSVPMLDLCSLLWALHFFLKKKKLFIWAHCCCLHTHQKRAYDPIADVCEPPCGCWELNSGPLEEQSMLLTTEPSLQPRALHLFLLLCTSSLLLGVIASMSIVSIFSLYWIWVKANKKCFPEANLRLDVPDTEVID